MRSSRKKAAALHAWVTVVAVLLVEAARAMNVPAVALARHAS